MYMLIMNNLSVSFLNTTSKIFCENLSRIEDEVIDGHF